MKIPESEAFELPWNPILCKKGHEIINHSALERPQNADQVVPTFMENSYGMVN